MSETIEGVLNTLQEMGFPKERAEMALTKTGWKGVEPAMEWLLANPEGQMDEDEDEVVEVPQPAEPPKAPLTEEEKAKQKDRLEALRIQKRAEREAKEAQEALDRERRMRSEGKAITGLKKELADKEIIRLAEERRREKLENKLAKERVKAQIAADRQARRDEEAARLRGDDDKPTQPVSQPKAEVSVRKDYDETRLQIRLPNGSAMVSTFKTKETLSAVRLYVELNRKDGLTGSPKLMTTFPKKIFEEDDYDKPLDALNLVPSAVLIVSK